MATVGVIGLGAMGGSVAARLAKAGVSVHGYDISPAAVQRLMEAGGRGSSTSLDELMSSSDVIITSLPTDEILWESLQSGILERLQPRHTFVELSTVLPQTMEKIALALQDKVAEIVDAPVSGGPGEALAGKLSLLVGVGLPRKGQEHGQNGDQNGKLEVELQPRTREVLSKLGAINIVGTVGSGKSLKLINNMMSLANTAVAMEALQLGADLGLEYQTMYDVLGRSGASSLMFNKRVPYILADDFTARFAVRLAEKDLRLTLQMAHGQRYATPLLANVHQRYEAAMAEGLEDEDIVALIKLHRRSQAEKKANAGEDKADRPVES